ncbi:MAG TPA: S-methyl-5'-thioadenosine phosphorylase, partial [Polyangia bacterium]|nr:S-methyl-5'-thioadenosine phosphorylase [Polyangia bacterium]
DCWHAEEEAVTATAVIEVLTANVTRAKEIVRGTLPKVAGRPRGCACPHAAQGAIMTARDAIPAAARERLRVLYGRYL